MVSHVYEFLDDVPVTKRTEHELFRLTCVGDKSLLVLLYLVYKAIRAVDPIFKRIFFTLTHD